MAHGGHKSKGGGGTALKLSHNKNNNISKKKKPKTTSLKNQIRSTLRFLQKDLPPEIRAAQESKLEGLKKQQQDHDRLAAERKIFLRDRKFKFFERRKIERRMRRLEKHQRVSLSQVEENKITEELARLKEDLEYVRFFPKAEKYVPLFSGDDNEELVEKRNKLRMQIKANLVAAAASGKDLEETGSEDDGLVDVTDDDFFASGSSSDEADADDELTDINASFRIQAPNVSTKSASGMSSDDRNQQKQKSARSLMPPPRPRPRPQKSSNQRLSYNTSSSTSNYRNRSASNSNNSRFSDAQAGQSSNMSSNVSSNSDAPKRRRKRRPKKKKQ